MPPDTCREDCPAPEARSVFGAFNRIKTGLKMIVLKQIM
jgi:hypothetical protein